MTIQEQFQLGLQLHVAGNLDGAEKHYRLVLSRDGNHPDALHLLGVIARERGNRGAALELIDRAIAIEENKAEYHANRGLTLAELRRFDEAVAAYQRSIALDPAAAQTHNNLGSAFIEMGRIDEAVACLEVALKLNPDYAKAEHNLGNAYLKTGRLEQAVPRYRRTLELSPDWREPSNNLGYALCRLGRFAEAEDVHRQAVRWRPDCALSHFNYGVSLLRRGEMEQGWEEHEWRLQVPELGMRGARIKMPRWDGGELGGKSLLLCAEQGLGDTIQFVRYVPLVAQRGGRITVAVQPELLSLVRCVPGAQRWVAAAGKLPECDAYCLLPSLPGVMRTNLTNIPADVPYISADTALRKKWLARAPEGRLKVGLVWAGQPRLHIDRERSLPLEQLAPLARSGAWFVSLQKGEAARQAAGSVFPIADWTDELKDFSDTAALVDNLDLVVTVDTAVAHLAGAMGKPVWVLLPFVPDWRWMLERSDSPWYPTMRLFRQEKLGDWETPVSQAARALKDR